MPPLPLATPARSSLKGKRSNLEGQRKRNVSFESTSWQPWKDTPETIRTLRLNRNDDPNDRNYTSTDEEADEFKDEPYENESSPGLEGESEDDNYSLQRSMEAPGDKYDEGFEDSYLLEMEEKLGHKRSAFSPLHQIRRTPTPTPAVSNPTSTWELVGPVTILRRNLQKTMENLQRKQDLGKSRPLPKQNPRKSRIKISSDGSPQLQNTPDAQLRKEIEAGKTPSQSGFSR